MNTSDNWLTTFVASTAGKYLIATVAGWLAGKLGLDPTTGAASIAGFASAAVALGMLLWGAYESSRSKIVVNGNKVVLSQMTTTDKNAVAAIAEKSVDSNAAAGAKL